MHAGLRSVWFWLTVAALVVLATVLANPLGWWMPSMVALVGMAKAKAEARRYCESWLLSAAVV